MPDHAVDYINNTRKRLVSTELINSASLYLGDSHLSESQVTVIEEYGIQITGILLYYMLKRFIVIQHYEENLLVLPALLSKALQALSSHYKEDSRWVRGSTRSPAMSILFY